MKNNRLVKSKVSTNKQPSITQLENAFKVIALASLQQHNESTEFTNVDHEALRIERCVEFFYVSEDHDMSFGEFAVNFLKTNLKDLVARTKFNSDYLEDLQNTRSESNDAILYRLAL
jgi:hypothetical protein